MYSIRPHISENIELDLPTTMYSVQPVIQSTKGIQNKQSINDSELKDIEQRQDILLEKLENLYNQLSLYQNKTSNKKGGTLSSVPIQEELVIHLSAKEPSKNILNLIEQFREKLSIRTYRHSSLHDSSFNNPLQNSSALSNNRSLTVIWAEGEDLPFMFHSHMKINDEQSILNLLAHQLTNN